MSVHSDTPHYEQVPFKVPEGWEWVRLDEVCEIKGGKRIPRGETFSKVPTEHIYIRVTNMKNNTIIDNEIKYINEDVFRQIKNYTISSDDLYLTIAGTIGNVGVVPSKFDGMNLTENAVKLTNLLCPKQYLMYVLLSTVAQNHFTTKFHQVAQPKLSIETAASTLIPLPPIEEQKRIAETIEYWFSLINQLENNKEELQSFINKIKSKILDLAIHGKLVPQDPNDEPASELLKRINPQAKITCDNGHDRKLPQGWCSTNLGTVGVWQSGGTPSRSNTNYYGGSIPWLKTGDLNDGLILDIPERITEEAVANSSAKINPIGSVLIAMYGATIGKLGILTFPATTNQACCACIEFHGVTQLFLFYFLLSQRMVFISKGGGGAQPNISKEIIVNTAMTLPPLAEQQRIVQKIEAFFSTLDSIQQSLEV